MDKTERTSPEYASQIAKAIATERAGCIQAAKTAFDGAWDWGDIVTRDKVMERIVDAIEARGERSK